MERLTKYLGTRYGYAKGAETTNADKIATLDKLGAYEDAEERGRLMILPERLSISRINYIQEIVARQLEYAEAEAEAELKAHA